MGPSGSKMSLPDRRTDGRTKGLSELDRGLWVKKKMGSKVKENQNDDANQNRLFSKINIHFEDIFLVGVEAIKIVLDTKGLYYWGIDLEEKQI